MAKKATTKALKKKSKALVDAKEPTALKRMPMVGLVEENVTNSGLDKFTEEALSIYGAYVVEDRAVPDYRDGLKPVHRSLLWSLAGLNLRPTGPYKKAARTVGDCIGKYHPHGDGSAYGAMVTIANTMPPAVDGQGNWGTPVNREAAMRYTEARMSKFSHLFLLDKEYLSVVPTVPNFSGDDTIPLFLPALLPYALFNGNIPAPAYGVRAGNPAFSFRSVAKVVVAMLQGKELSAKRLAKTLEVQHPWGCTASVDPDEMLRMVKTGSGRVSYAPTIEEDFDKRKILIRSFVPTSLSSLKNIDKSLEKISALNFVRKCYSKQGKKSKGSGPYGALFIVECQRNIGTEDFYDVLDAVEKIVSGNVSYRLGITVRKSDAKNDFRYLGYHKYFEAWINYRVKLEHALIKSLIVKTERDLHIQEVYLFAVVNIDKLLKALPKVLMSKEPDKALAVALKIPIEDATIILDRQVRQLAKMNAAKLKEKISELKSELKQLVADEKNPAKRAAADTKERVAKYLKNPDKTKSGISL